MKTTKTILIILLTLFLVSCTVTAGIFSQIVNERAVFNGSLNDKASPTAMTEDENYFYVVMNRPYRASKTLVYPEGYVDSIIEDEQALTEKDENRYIEVWESIDLNAKDFFTNTTDHSLSCRTIFYHDPTDNNVYDGAIYAVFSNDALTYDTSIDFEHYSKILRLSADGKSWIDTKMPQPPYEAPQRNLTDASLIDPSNNRLFSYAEDLDDYENGTIDLGTLSIDERNSYEIAYTYNMNQIRRPEAIQFFTIENSLYILYSDTYLRDDELSSEINFARNPIYKLYKVDNLETTPSLIPVTIQDDARVSKNTELISEKEVLEAIKAEMVASNSNFCVARYKVLTDQNQGTKLGILKKAGDGEREYFNEILKPADPSSEGGSVSYAQKRRLYFQDTHYSTFSRHIIDNKSTQTDKNFLFSKDFLYKLRNASTTNPTLEDWTEKLPLGLEITAENEQLVPPGHTFPDPDDESEENQDNISNQFKRYRFCDFYIFTPEGENQRIHVSLAISTVNNVNTRFIVAGAEGTLDDKTPNSWILQDINTYNLKETSSSFIEVTPTFFSYYKADKVAIGANNNTREINSLTMATNNGFYHTVPNPGDGNQPGAFDGPEIDKAGEDPVPYEANILSISLSSSYITGFYPSKAKIDVDGTLKEVSVMFAFTAGNGLWLNYNQFWNRE